MYHELTGPCPEIWSPTELARRGSTRTLDSAVDRTARR